MTRLEEEKIVGTVDGLRVSLPISVKLCLICSTIGLILIETECIQGLRTKLWVDGLLPHPWFYPALIFAPWAFCVWGLSRARRLVSHGQVDP